jgi:hypothetical protein
MIDLDRSLGELADRLQIRGGEWLVDDVVRRLGEPAGRHPPRRVVLFAGALAAVAVLAVVTLPGPRHAVARWLGFDSVRIEPGVTVPTTIASTTIASTTSVPATSATLTSSPPIVTTTTATSVASTALDLGEPVSMEAATSRTGLPDPTPALLGEQRSIHVVRPPDSGQIVLVYPASDLVPQSSVTGVGALVSVIPAQIQEGYFAKMLGDTATVTPVDVNGNSGYWIAGSPHQLLFDRNGQTEPVTLRLATNTLLWQRGDNIFRIEADISIETALRIAASIP